MGSVGGVSNREMEQRAEDEQKDIRTSYTLNKTRKYCTYALVL